MLIFIIVILIIVICRLRDNTNYTFTGGNSDVFYRDSPNKQVGNALRIFIISNKINEILNIPETTRKWINSFYYGYINYLALEEPRVYENTLGYFPYNIPADTKAIKRVLEVIKYDVILNQSGDMYNLQDRIDRITLMFNSYKTINYKLEWYTDMITIASSDMTVTIPRVLYNKYKVGVKESDVLSMLLRAGSDGIYNPSKPLTITHSLSSVDPLLYNKLKELYSNKAIEGFASPINHSIDYFCIYEQDGVFPGCMGQLSGKSIKKRFKTLFLMNPPFDIPSIKFLYSLTNRLTDSSMLITIPCRDMGTFSYAYGRRGAGKQNDWDLIKNFLKLPTFKGVIILPALFMYYLNLESGNKHGITFDTIMIILSNDNSKDAEFFNNMKQTIIDVVANNMPRTTLRKKNLKDPDESRIREHFSGNLANQIIKDLKFSKDSVFAAIPGTLPAVKEETPA